MSERAAKHDEALPNEVRALPARRLPDAAIGFALFALVLMLVLVGDLVWRGSDQLPIDAAWQVAGGDASRGPQAMVAHGCISCHTIPGLRSAVGRVGPQLHDFRNQTFIAGRLKNSPENLVRWLMNPREVDPQTAMPYLGVTEQEARDMAAYLYNVR